MTPIQNRRIPAKDWLRLVLTSLALAGAIVSGCKKPEPAPTTFVAKVGESTISEEDFKRELKRRNLSATVQQKETALQDLIRTQALVERAREAGFDKDPETIARVNRLIASAYEEKMGGPERRTTNSVSELEEYYAAHQQEFIAPSKIRVAEILVRVPGKATEEKQKEFQAKAESILQRAKSLGTNVVHFGELAREFSEEQSSRYQGGDMGWLTRPEAESRWGADVATALFQLAANGDLTPPLRGADGLMLFKRMDKQDSKPRPLAEIKDLIAYRVTREKEAAAQKKFEEKLRSGLKIEINRPLADSIIASVTNAPVAAPSTPGQ
jgi:parvulin-like peptidyl-prolyl isomerase